MMSATVPVSTILPLFMTIMRSAASAITPMSWVMSITATPRSAQSRFKTLMIWACTETSSAEVGSSAITSSGSAASASEITTRWRIPPEN